MTRCLTKYELCGENSKNTLYWTVLLNRELALICAVLCNTLQLCCIIRDEGSVPRGSSSLSSPELRNQEKMAAMIGAPRTL